jgi:hypothetical protein
MSKLSPAESIAWGVPCRKLSAHIDYRGDSLEVPRSSRYRYGKGSCVLCERDRIIARALARRIAPPGESHLGPWSYDRRTQSWTRREK